MKNKTIEKVAKINDLIFDLVYEEDIDKHNHYRELLYNLSEDFQKLYDEVKRISGNEN